MPNQQTISSQTSAPSPASNPNLNPAAQPAPNQATGGNGGFEWGQSGTGSVAMAYGAIMQLMALMTKIQSMNSQQAGTSVQVAGDLAKAAYAQSINAASLTEKSGMLDAASSFVSGVVAIGGAAASIGSSAISQPKITELSKDNEQLGSFSTTLTKRKQPGPMAGTENSNDAAAATKRQNLGPDGEARIKALTSDAHSVTTLAHAQRGNPALAAKNTEAIECMTPKEAEKFSEKLNTAEENNSRSTHNVSNSMQTTQQQISLFKEVITGFSTGGITVVKTGYTNQAGIDSANASLYQGQAQQLYGMFSSQAQQATQNQGKGLEELQILAQMNQARA